MKGAGKKTIGQDPDYEERRKVAVRAHERGLLIHSQTSGLIYTPREFLDSKEKVIYEIRGVETYSNLTHFYPKAAIERKLGDLRNARAELERAERDLQDFMERLLKAFEVLPRNK